MDVEVLHLAAHQFEALVEHDRLRVRRATEVEAPLARGRLARGAGRGVDHAVSVDVEEAVEAEEDVARVPVPVHRRGLGRERVVGGKVLHRDAVVEPVDAEQEADAGVAARGHLAERGHGLACVGVDQDVALGDGVLDLGLVLVLGADGDWLVGQDRDLAAVLVEERDPGEVQLRDVELARGTVDGEGLPGLEGVGARHRLDVEAEHRRVGRGAAGVAAGEGRAQQGDEESAGRREGTEGHGNAGGSAARCACGCVAGQVAAYGETTGLVRDRRNASSRTACARGLRLGGARIAGVGPQRTTKARGAARQQAAPRDRPL